MHTIQVFWPFKALCSYKLCCYKKTCYWFDKEQRKQFEINLALINNSLFKHCTQPLLFCYSLLCHIITSLKHVIIFSLAGLRLFSDLFWIPTILKSSAEYWWLIFHIYLQNIKLSIFWIFSLIVTMNKIVKMEIIW